MTCMINFSTIQSNSFFFFISMPNFRAEAERSLFFLGRFEPENVLDIQSFTTSCNKKIASSMLENFPKYLSLFSC